jgi:hypothetical protein
MKDLTEEEYREKLILSYRTALTNLCEKYDCTEKAVAEALGVSRGKIQYHDKYFHSCTIERLKERLAFLKSVKPEKMAKAAQKHRRRGVSKNSTLKDHDSPIETVQLCKERSAYLKQVFTDRKHTFYWLENGVLKKREYIE